LEVADGLDVLSCLFLIQPPIGIYIDQAAPLLKKRAPHGGCLGFRLAHEVLKAALLFRREVERPSAAYRYCDKEAGGENA